MLVKGNKKWMYLSLPYNVSTGSISTLVTLQILDLSGNALTIGYVMSLSNAVLIFASIFWGITADRFSRRKQILISFAGTSISLILMQYSNNIIILASNYAFLTFISTASVTPMNMLIMETEDKKHWASAFSLYSFLSSIGVLISLLISSVLVLFISIRRLIFILGLVALFTFIAGLKMVPEPQIPLERVAMIHNKESFFTRLKHLPLFFLHLPSKNSFKIFRLSRLTKKPINYVPLLYIGIIIFYISSGIFNTVYPAGLYVKGLSRSLVLLVISIGMIFQIGAFYISGKLTEQKGEKRIAYLSLLLRGSSYSAMGLVAILMSGNVLFIVLNSIFYPLAAGIAYALYYTSSSTMIFKIVGERRQGTGLGVYSTLVGASLFLGSLLSGYIVHYLGYGMDFVIAGVLLLVDSYIFNTLEEG